MVNAYGTPQNLKDFAGTPNLNLNLRGPKNWNNFWANLGLNSGSNFAGMRVIAGEAKGLSLKGVRGKGLRPTSERVREAIFSALTALPTDWSRVLDLYAGTGAVGIEALSRGAEWADFVEQNPRFCAIIKENLHRTGLSLRAKVYCLEVRKALSILKQRYSLVFLDPPYNDPSLPSALTALASSSLVGPGTIIAAEHSTRLSLGDFYGSFRLAKVLRHGDAAVSIFCFGGEG